MSSLEPNGNLQKLTFLLRNRAETAAWGRELGARLRAGDVIALIGDLGTGKTTLTQALAQGLGVVEPVSSPTFTLVQEYRGREPLFHFDPYRLDRAEDMADLGFDEYLERGGVVVVEWADKIAALLPPDCLTVNLKIRDDASMLDFEAEDTPRRLMVEINGARWEKLMLELLMLPEIAALQTQEEGSP